MVRWISFLVALWLGSPLLRAQGTEQCNCSVDLAPGWNLVSLPCNDGTVSLSQLLASPPEGSRIQAWRRQQSAFQSISFAGGAWSLPSTTIPSGLGVFFFNPLPGATKLAITGHLPSGAPLAIPTSGCAIVGRKFCGPSPGFDPFMDVFGQPAPDGTTVWLWNGNGYTPNTFFGGAWDLPGDWLPPGQAFW